MWRIVLVVLGVVVLAVAGFVGRILWLAGTFKSIEPHFAGTCRLVQGPVGPEDITIHPRTGVAFISASDRRALTAGKPVPGAIFAYDLNADAPQPINLTPEADTSFQPHGISLWAGEHDDDVLFVINHPAPGTSPHAHSVEAFDVRNGTLIHRATLTDPLLVMPNDLAAVGVDQFYLTNTHAHPPGTMQTIETYLQRPGAQVLYYGPGGFRSALTDLVLPNGINVSRDGTIVYLARMTDRQLQLYTREPGREALTLRQTILLGTAPDNVEVDDEGSVWIGAHPKLLRTAAHMRDAKELSPSQVLKITADGTVKDIYLDRGDNLSGSSVGAVRGNRLLIGQIAGNGFLDCVMSTEAPTG